MFVCVLFDIMTHMSVPCDEGPPATKGHLPRRATFALNQRWPALAGTTVGRNNSIAWKMTKKLIILYIGLEKRPTFNNSIGRNNSIGGKMTRI